MKLKNEHLTKLAQKLLNSLNQAHLIEVLTSESQVLKTMIEVLAKDQNKLSQLEKKTNQMMDQFRLKIEAGEIDYAKMHAMIKKQLIKEMGLTTDNINYSEEHLSQLAFNVHDQLYMDEAVNYIDEDKALSLIKEQVIAFFALGDKLEQAVKDKIASLSRRVIPGTDEWRALFDKYLLDEMKKHGL